MKSFSENLRHARTERGLSQEQLAKLIDITSESSQKTGISTSKSLTTTPDITQ